MEDLVYFIDILRQNGIHILWPYFVVIWYISSRFGMLYEEKSGNPGFNSFSAC
jgi:hypothetical protein